VPILIHHNERAANFLEVTIMDAKRRLVWIYSAILIMAMIGATAAFGQGGFGRFERRRPAPPPAATPEPPANRPSHPLLAPSTPTPVATPYGMRPGIVQTILLQQDLLALRGALAGTTLRETLLGEGPFTLFAPTNEAINRLSTTVTAVLTSPDSLAKREEILSFHVVQGLYPSSELKSTGTLQTLNGAELHFGGEGNAITVEGALLTGPDIMTSNGIIHKIDGLLLPPEPPPALPEEIMPFDEPLEIDIPDTVHYPVPN